ncbi:alginate lyase family protein [Burkholderiaceae bacterium DAT-1]|nr:alginate lyase family protein [Burkholderiaceae bacterium DAT-1]
MTFFTIRLRSPCLSSLLLAVHTYLCLAACMAAPLLIGPAGMDAIKGNNARNAPLLKRCEKELAHAASPVADFSPPPHYTDTGSVMTDISKQFDKDGAVAYRAGLCFALTHQPRFAAQTTRILDAWATTLQTVGSKQGGTEMNFFIPQMVLAAGFVRGHTDWDDHAFRALLVQHALPHSHASYKNNHANWGIWMESVIAAYLGDETLLNRNRDRWLTLLPRQIADDGSLPLEICRSDTNNYCDGPHKGKSGLAYTHYTLLPSALAAQLFATAGQPVWDTPAGTLLGRAYARAANWTLHPETFPYFEANQGQLNGIRNAAYFSLLQRHYPNAEAAQVLNSMQLSHNGLEFGVLFGEIAQ